MAARGDGRRSPPATDAFLSRRVGAPQAALAECGVAFLEHRPPCHRALRRAAQRRRTSPSFICGTNSSRSRTPQRSTRQTSSIAITDGRPGRHRSRDRGTGLRQQPSWSQRCFAVGDFATLRRAAGHRRPAAAGRRSTRQPMSPALPPRCLPVLPARDAGVAARYGAGWMRAGPQPPTASPGPRAPLLHPARSTPSTAPIHKRAPRPASIIQSRQVPAGAGDQHLGCGVNRVPVRRLTPATSCTHRAGQHPCLAARCAPRRVTSASVLQTLHHRDHLARQLPDAPAHHNRRRQPAPGGWVVRARRRSR